MIKCGSKVCQFKFQVLYSCHLPLFHYLYGHGLLSLWSNRYYSSLGASCLHLLVRGTDGHHTSREFFGQKHRVDWYCHSCENSVQWQRSAVRSTTGCIQSGLEKVIASYQLTPLATIGDQIVDTLNCPWMGFIASKNKTIHTHPSLLHSKLGCLLFSTSSLNTWHNITYGGYGKASFFSFGVGEMSERSFREKCLN